MSRSWPAKESSHWLLLQHCVAGDPAQLWAKHPPPARALLGSVGGKSDRRQPLHFTAMKYNTKCQDLYEMLADEGGGGRAEIWQAGCLLMAQAASALLPLRRGGVEGSGPMQGHPAPSLLAHTSQMALTRGSKYARKTNECQC